MKDMINLFLLLQVTGIGWPEFLSNILQLDTTYVYQRKLIENIWYKD